MVRVLVSSTRCSMKRAAVPSILVAVVLLAVAVIAEAQQQAKVSKIGWLSARPASNSGQEVIVRMLRDLGYVEGQNIAFEYRYANNKLDRFPALADELVRLKVDVLLTPGTPGALALKNTTKTIPIVFADVTGPVAAGLVDSIARPGGNITGFSSIEAVLAGANDWSYSRKLFPRFHALPCCGIRMIQAPRSNGKKANWRHENWVCNFTPWRSPAPINSRARSRRPIKSVALGSSWYRARWPFLIKTGSRTKR